MARIGLSDLHFAPITDGVNGETYGAPVRIAGAISADLAISYTETPFQGDGETVGTASQFSGGTIKMNVSEIPPHILEKLLGGRRDANRVYVQAQESKSPPVAIGFKAKKTDGTYRYMWLYRVVFSLVSESYTTESDSIAFDTDTIEGRIYRRHLPDYSGELPWRAMYDVPRPITQRGLSQAEGIGTVASGWFEQVYEPVERNADETPRL